MPAPADDAFARRLFEPKFRAQVQKASRPIIPAILRPEMDDVIQQALIRAYERRDQFGGTTQEDLLGWVLVILKNLTRDLLDGRKGLLVTEVLSEEPEDKRLKDPALAAQETETGPEEKIALPPKAHAWLETAQGILGLLSEEDREVLLLRLGHGLSTHETAELLSRGGKPISEEAVKMRLYRAQKRINELAEQVGLKRPNPPRHQE